MKTKKVATLAIVCLVVVLLTVLSLTGLQMGKSTLVPAASNITREDAFAQKAVVVLGVAEKTEAAEEAVADETAAEATSEEAADESGETADEATVVEAKDFETLYKNTLFVLQARALMSEVNDVNVVAQGTDKVRVEFAASDSNMETVINEMTLNGFITFRDAEGNVIVDGTHLAAAGMNYDSTNGVYYVGFEFDEEGKKLFAAGTAAAVGSSISVYQDENQLASASISEALTEGYASLGFSDYSVARALAVALSNRTLPTEVTVITKGTADAVISEGQFYRCLWAIAAALVIAAIALIVVYKKTGFAAAVSMILGADLLILFIGEVYYIGFGAASLIGLVIVLAMALLCNIDICARIKAGASVKAAYSANVVRTCEYCGVPLALALLMQYIAAGNVIACTSMVAIGSVIVFLVTTIVTRILVGCVASEAVSK